ncbi:hypothetical protein Tco_0334014 [Tanacetum coccineum]
MTEVWTLLRDTITIFISDPSSTEERERSDDEGHSSDDEGHGSDDEGHGLGDEDHRLDNEGRSLEGEGLGLEEEKAAPKGQQQAVLVVDTAASEPLGIVPLSQLRR